jgi:hypothetical protein
VEMVEEMTFWEEDERREPPSLSSVEPEPFRVSAG